MEQYTVTGMSCAACSAHVEKAVSKVQGVTACSVNLLTNSMKVEGTADPSKITEAVKNAGYGAELIGSEEKSKPAAENGDPLADTETPKLIKRLIASVCLLLPLMYISMGHTMWGFYLPEALSGNPAGTALIQLILSSVVMLINKRFFINGARGLLHRAPNMDTLVAMGASVSYVYSIYVLFQITAASSNMLPDAAAEYSHGLYFESAAMILTLITVGKTLEAHSKGKTTNAIKALMRLAPKTAVIIRDGKEVSVSIDEVKTGDIFVVKPGESIPCDGIVIQGSSAVNEAALTGESIPADKTTGSEVSAATINQSGFLTCEATKVGENTVLSQIIKMVSDASADKAPVSKAADKVSGVFVPVVMGIALVTFFVWLIAGEAFAFALQRAVSVLVISCPCALGLATPVAVMAGSGVGAKNGILFKTASALEAAAKIKLAALDKTGTVTQGEPEVTDIIPCDGVSEEQLLKTAFALEAKSEHPLARAVTAFASNKGLSPDEISDFEAVPGNGLRASTNASALYGGNLDFMKQYTSVDEKTLSAAEKLSSEGKTPLFFGKDGTLEGIIAVADVIKKDSPQAVRQLLDMGIRVVMLTGDNERTAAAIAKKAGISEVTAGVLPNGKADEIKRLQQYGGVLMAGDGINDAPALTRADIGVAVGAGTDIAIDAADVVLIKNRLTDIPAAVRLSRATLRIIHQNLFWAFFYNVIGIPLAAGVWIPVFGWTLNPMFGALAMSLSSFCVVMNALRLNFFKLHKPQKSKNKPSGGNNEKITPLKNSDENILKEQPEMTEITVKVDGMMCPMCEAHVNDSVRNNFNVKKVASSHKKGETVILSENELDISQLTIAIEKTGYKVLGIEAKQVNK